MSSPSETSGVPRPRLASKMDIAAVVNSLKATQVYDYLRISKSKDLGKFLAADRKPGASDTEDDDVKQSPVGSRQASSSQAGPAVVQSLREGPEKLQFSDSVIKINKREKQQGRHLVLTDVALYNFLPKKYSKCQRRIAYRKLSCLVLSQSSDEIVFQVRGERDYRFIIQRRAEVIEVVTKFYELETGGKLPMQLAPDKELKSFTHTQSASLSGTHSLLSFSKKPDADGTPASPNPVASTSAIGLGSSASSNPSAALSSPGRDPQPLSPNPLRMPSSPAPNHSRTASAIPHFNVADTALKFVPGVVVGFRSRNVLYEGWLTKRKGSSGKWDRKYFILTHDKLSYMAPRIKGNFKISGCKVSYPTRSKDSSSSPAHTPLAAAAPSAQAAPPPSDSGPADAASGSQTISLNVFAAAQTEQQSTRTGHRGSAVTKADFLHFAFIVQPAERREPLHLAAASRADMERWVNGFTVDVPAEDQEFVHLEGWLMKKDPTTKMWRLRYFVIIKDRCWYFEMEEKGNIDLTNGVGGHDLKRIENTESTHTNFAGMTSKTRFAYRFQVTDGARAYELGADSKEDLDGWIASIEKASRKHTRGLSVEHGKKGGMAVLPEELQAAIAQEAPTHDVTFVFTDVQSSTNLWETAPDAMDQSLAIHDAILRQLLKIYRGYEIKTEGDAFFVAFFTVLDAAMWCMAVQRALAEVNWPEELTALAGAKRETAPDGTVLFNGMRIRMGIHTGQPTPRRNPVTGRMDYFGPVVNLSARVSDAGHGGQITMTQDVFDVLTSAQSQNDDRMQEFLPLATKDMGDHQLKGIKHLTRIYELLPGSLAGRSALFPPIRTLTNEKKATEDAVQRKLARVASMNSDTAAAPEEGAEDDIDDLDEELIAQHVEAAADPHAPQPEDDDLFDERSLIEEGAVTHHELDVVSDAAEDGLVSPRAYALSSPRQASSSNTR